MTVGAKDMPFSPSRSTPVFNGVICMQANNTYTVRPALFSADTYDDRVSRLTFSSKMFRGDRESGRVCRDFRVRRDFCPVEFKFLY